LGTDPRAMGHARDAGRPAGPSSSRDTGEPRHAPRARRAGQDSSHARRAQRLDQLESAIETLRALWQPGTGAYHGERVTLPETTCYPRPVGPVPIIVG